MIFPIITPPFSFHFIGFDYLTDMYLFQLRHFNLFVSFFV